MSYGRVCGSTPSGLICARLPNGRRLSRANKLLLFDTARLVPQLSEYLAASLTRSQVDREKRQGKTNDGVRGGESARKGSAWNCVSSCVSSAGWILGGWILGEPRWQPVDECGWRRVLASSSSVWRRVRGRELRARNPKLACGARSPSGRGGRATANKLPQMRD